MTGMLASVNSVEEALLVLSADVDIIDLKQPALGALGALETGLVKKIVAEIDGRCPVSATIGDLPMQPDTVFNAVKAMAETGVDYIKIGFFPDGDWQGTVEKLVCINAGQNLALIAVLFADAQPDLGIMSALKKAGFKGVMLDTMDKQKRFINSGHGKDRHSAICQLSQSPSIDLRTGRFAQTGRYP